MRQPRMAKANGISVSSVQRIWRSHGLQPHRMRQFKLSNAPRFADKFCEMVGLYVDPPAHAVVLSINEKSQIQALDRTHPGLPLKRGRCLPRHRHQEFIRFLNAVEAEVPAGKLMHAIVDNCAVHKHTKVIEWLNRYTRWASPFNPTSASWLNAVEGFFAKLTKRRLKCGLHSLMSHQATIKRFLAETHAEPRPFHRTKDTDAIIAAVKRGQQTLDSPHSLFEFANRYGARAGWSRASTALYPAT